MATENIPGAQIAELEEALANLRGMLEDTPDRGFDSARTRRKIIAAISRTRADLILARLEEDFEG